MHQSLSAFSDFKLSFWLTKIYTLKIYTGNASDSCLMLDYVCIINFHIIIIIIIIIIQAYLQHS